MAKVELFTTPWCPYCHAAKSLLDDKGVDYTETDVSKVDAREAMIERAHGRRTVPQIFIDGHHVGGYDDLAALDRRGQLDPMLRPAAA